MKSPTSLYFLGLSIYIRGKSIDVRFVHALYREKDSVHFFAKFFYLLMIFQSALVSPIFSKKSIIKLTKI